MAERRWLIAFNQEVADPGKSIGHHRPQQRIPGMANGKSHNQCSQSKQRPNRVHRSIACIAVLVQVEGEKVFVTGEFLWRHFICPWALRKPVRAYSLEFYYDPSRTSAVPAAARPPSSRAGSAPWCTVPASFPDASAETLSRAGSVRRKNGHIEIRPPVSA